MKDTLDLLLNFLKSNSQYNRRVQKLALSRWLLRGTKREKFKSLLHGSLNTQPQPNLDHICSFWKKFDKFENECKKINSIESLQEFLKVANPSITNLKEIYLRLSKEKATSPTSILYPGWGKKTSALFTRNLFLAHQFKLLNSRGLEKDIDSQALYLPVDAVILHIFTELKCYQGISNFYQINKVLHDNYPKYSDMLAWDDLWFWGFINQRSQSANKDAKGQEKVKSVRKPERKTEWNEAKLRSLEIFSSNDIKEIKMLSTKFRRLVKKS